MTKGAMYMPEDILSLNDPKKKASQEDVMANLTFDIVYGEIAYLCDLLTYENQLLRHRMVDEIRDMHQEKLDLIKKIELRKELMKKHIEAISKWSAKERAEFEELSNELGDVLNENMHRVSVAKEVNAKVMRSVARAMEEKTHQENGYTKKGASAKQSVEQRIFGMQPHIAINESI